MEDPRLNIKTHEWYQKQNHVKIPRIAESKKYLDYAYTSEGGGTPVETFGWKWEQSDKIVWENADLITLQTAT